MKLIKILLIIILFFSLLTFYGCFRIFWIIDEKDKWLQDYLDKKFFEENPHGQPGPRYQDGKKILI